MGVKVNVVSELKTPLRKKDQPLSTPIRKRLLTSIIARKEKPIGNPDSINKIKATIITTRKKLLTTYTPPFR